VKIEVEIERTAGQVKGKEKEVRGNGKCKMKPISQAHVYSPVPYGDKN
jgi:hypothetical protein